MAERPVAALVGRGNHLEVLNGCLHAAAGGHPRIVIVSGETGVGKTRLLREFLDRGEVLGLIGSCFPVAGEALPFAPLAQALRRMGEGPQAHALKTHSDLVRLVGASEEDSELAPGSFHQLGFLQSVLGLLGSLGRSRPVVHVVEDIQWADRSTLDLVRFLATNLVDERVLLVLTYRVDLLTNGSPVRTWLAEFGRLPRVHQLRLSRLTNDETVRLVEAFAGPDIDPALARAIAARSDGNPLFAQELVRHTGSPASGAHGVPGVLGELLEARLSALPAATKSIVAAAAVLAGRPSLGLLAATAGLPVETVEDALVPALEHHVLSITEDELVDFDHPALREVAYSAILPTKRKRLHHAAAEALEALSGNPLGGVPVPGRSAVPAEIARHWHLAGDLRRALDSAMEAAGAAERNHAFGDAHANLLLALQLRERIDSDVDRIDVVRRAARSARAIGDFNEAERLLAVALDADLPHLARAAILDDFAVVRHLQGEYQLAETALRTARSLLPPGPPSLLTVRISSAFAAHYARTCRYEQAETECAEALANARVLGARQEEGRLHNTLGAIAGARGRAEEALTQLRQALAIARECRDPEAVCDAAINLWRALSQSERHEEALAHARDGVEEITRLGLLLQSGPTLLANAAESLIRLGRCDEAEALVARSLGYQVRGGIAVPTLCRAAQLRVIRGDVATARRYCAQASAAVEAGRAPIAWRRDVAEVSAEVELWARSPEEAFGIVVAGLEALTGSEEQRWCAWLYCLGLRALADLADSRRDPPSRQDQRQMHARLTRSVTACQAPPGAIDPPATPAWTATAEAESARAAGRSEPSLWTGAELEWDRLHRPLESAYATWRRAEAMIARGVDSAATAALNSADEQARRAGIVPLVDEISRFAQWHHIERPQRVNGQVHGAAADPSSGRYGLTPRELQVLASLAAGRTNQEVGEALGISSKTASVHVSNIMRKLDVSGRAEACRVAHRLGLDGQYLGDAGEA